LHTYFTQIKKLKFCTRLASITAVKYGHVERCVQVFYMIALHRNGLRLIIPKTVSLLDRYIHQITTLSGKLLTFWQPLLPSLLLFPLGTRCHHSKQTVLQLNWSEF